MTETQKLAARFDAAVGLVDVRFYLIGEASHEEVCQEVNRLYDALANGDCATLDFKDSHCAP